MHSNIYEPISMQIYLTIDTTKCYFLIIVLGTLGFIQVHRGARKQQSLHQLSHKVFSWFGGNSVCCGFLFVCLFIFVLFCFCFCFFVCLVVCLFVCFLSPRNVYTVPHRCWRKAWRLCTCNGTPRTTGCPCSARPTSPPDLSTMAARGTTSSASWWQLAVSIMFDISPLNNNNERISRAPFHVKRARLHWTGANTKHMHIRHSKQQNTHKSHIPYQHTQK